MVPAFALLAAGCGAPDWIETYPDIAERARQQPQTFAAEAFRKWDSMDGMFGSYRVRVSRGVGNRSFDTFIYLLRSNLLQIELLSPAAQAEGYLTAGRSEIGFWLSEDDRLYRGPLERGAFGRALGIDLEPADVVAVLMGFAVASAAGREPTATWDEAERRIRVTNGEGATAWLHPVWLRFDRATFATSGGEIEVVFEEWAEDPAPVPTRLSVRVPEEDMELQLRLAPRWRANPEGLTPEHFDVYPVAGAIEAPLARLEAEGGLLRRGLER